MAKKKEDKQELNERGKLIVAVQRMFGSPGGKELLEMLDKRYWGKRTTLSPKKDGGLDTDLMLAREGERNVIMFIRDCIEANAYDHVIQEGKGDSDEEDYLFV